jgi:hypothetical protein
VFSQEAMNCYYQDGKNEIKKIILKLHLRPIKSAIRSISKNRQDRIELWVIIGALRNSTYINRNGSSLTTNNLIN